jgi:Sulfatase
VAPVETSTIQLKSGNGTEVSGNGAEVMSWLDGGNKPFRGEKATNWEGGFRVPMAMRWPGVVQPGRAPSLKHWPSAEQTRRTVNGGDLLRLKGELPLDQSTTRRAEAEALLLSGRKGRPTTERQNRSS